MKQKKDGIHYFMDSTALDPTGNGDTRSWFFFYKWGAGVTSIDLAPNDPQVPKVGDILFLHLDEVLVASAPILEVTFNLSTKCTEVHFDSDRMTKNSFAPLSIPRGDAEGEVEPVSSEVEESAMGKTWAGTFYVLE